MTSISIINCILLTFSMLSLWRVYTNLGYHIGYLECANPEVFPTKSILIAIGLSAAYFIFSAIIASIGIAGFMAQVFMFVSWAAGLFILNAILSLIFYLPSYRFANTFVSLIFASPFSAGTILMKILNLA